MTFNCGKVKMNNVKLGFWKTHKKLEVAYKLIHWSLATFILIISLPALVFVVVTFGFDNYPIRLLYGFVDEKTRKHEN